MLKKNHAKTALLIFVLILLRPRIDDILAYRLDIYISRVLNINTLLALSVFAGALFPDIDFIWILRKWHRKLLHNIFAVAIVAFLLWFGFLKSIHNSTLVAGTFALGSMVHIGEDSLTEHGTYIFWPMSNKFRLHWRISTGTWEERIAMWIIVALIFIIYFAVSIVLNF